jgi:hypothetical protein
LIHDRAAQKEAFGSWKEAAMHEQFAALRAKHLEDRKKERAIHKKTRSAMMIKLFSEKISPGVHDDAARKEGFASRLRSGR